MRAPQQRLAFPAVFMAGPDNETLVTFPDFPEAITFGTSEGEAMQAARDCLREALRSRMKNNEPIPEPSVDVLGARWIDPPVEIAAKAAVYQAFRSRGMAKTALAERLDLHEGEVRRILDPNHRTKLERLDEAARALGGRLEVSFVAGEEDA